MIKNKRTTVVVFTFNMPFGSTTESAFLHVELEYLKRKFDRLIVIPQMEADDIQTSPPCEINLGLAKMLRARSSRFNSYLSALISPVYWRENFRHLREASIERTRTILWFHAFGSTISRWVDHFCSSENLDFAATVFYSYWLDGIAFGLSIAKDKAPRMKLVSRVHRVDLYEDEESPGYFPFREHVLGRLNMLYPISDHGLDYLSVRYPAFVNKFMVSRLGVRAGEFVTKRSSGHEIRIVSCSQLRMVKRIDLMALAIGLFAQRHPEYRVFWDHFGGGNMSAPALSADVTARFWGNVANQTILDFYKNNCVDVFLNMSSSEGIPVSIMEAMAHGIPVVAPCVGGIPEIVNSENGILLDANPSPDQVVLALQQIVFDPQSMLKKIASQRMWQDRYNADKNFDRFSSDLLELTYGS